MIKSIIISAFFTFSTIAALYSQPLPAANVRNDDQSWKTIFKYEPEWMKGDSTSLRLHMEQIIITKNLAYDKYTLTDVYPYKDTTRMFQWDKIKEKLAMIEDVQKSPSKWGILQNRRNVNGVAPVAKNAVENAYKRISDAYGTDRYQSVPLYGKDDLSTPERYGNDGALVRLISEANDTATVEWIYIGSDEWKVPTKYIKKISDTIKFTKVICVDRTNQNITTLEWVGNEWLVRSMNPATTGLHNPPYQQETPLGIFVVQEKKDRMVYLVDGSSAIGGFAPYASRFSNGGYIHGVPVNAPGKNLIEYSWTLGSTPRSHMCVRNATSHAKFVYDWAPVYQSLVVVIE